MAGAEIMTFFTGPRICFRASLPVVKSPVDSITIQDVLAVKAACGDRKYLANRAIEFVRAAYNWSAAQPDGKINFWDCPNPAKNVTSFAETSRKIFMQHYATPLIRLVMRKSY